MITQSLKTILSFSEENYFDKYLNEIEMNLKKSEIQDLKKFVNLLDSKLNSNSDLYRGYVTGYSFKKLTGEFDLLRFTEDYIINIEIKSNATEKELEEQLIKKKFYLNSTKYELLQYGYLSTKNKLYKLSSQEILQEITIEEFISDGSNLQYKLFVDLDNLFKAEKFIISPFNNTREFIEEKYFLNDEQLNVKKKLMEFLENDDPIIKLTGPPGCGKSLVLYDFYKECEKMQKNIVLMHCSSELNEGQQKLINNYGWKIFPPKNNDEFLNEDAEIFIIDETQRKYPTQLAEIYSYIKKNKKKLILSYDPQQTLVKREQKWKVYEMIENEYEGLPLILDTKVRNNEEINNFIKLLFNKKQSREISNFKNINVIYTSSVSESKILLNNLSETYTVIDYTLPSKNRRGHEEIKEMTYGCTSINSHNVIGQEFDNVCIVLGKQFFYDREGHLRANDINDQLDLLKLLYQNVTRTKNKLMIIVNENKNLYIDLLSIINPKPKKMYKLKELENVGYNNIPNSKGVFCIFNFNGGLSNDDSAEKEMNIKGNILYVKSTKNLRNSIKKLIENIKFKKSNNIDEFRVEDILNLKVEWIDSKKNEQIFSYIVNQHINKYKETPFFNNNDIKTKKYPENIEKKYKYIIDKD
ncbi:DNA/RNA helicase domain-containing protein [Staphylococcus epidermidis]|uniref:DNA/RNA helicase domain-containing protein n=1 Tax=Staphylococcus epidermidis TaxID=1282 RepID=UPI00138DF2F4